jgi:tRNA (guanine-N7-)-methyltransferase
MRPVRSFVLREGRLTPAQEKALAELLPRYGVEPGAGRLDFAEIFGREAPVWLEIGFGNGDALHHMAARHPEINFVGVEVHRPGVGQLLRAIDDDGLTNVRVYRGDAAELLRDHVGDSTLSRLLLFFPDPWPKKRHHKRRIVQSPFVREVARALEPGGIFHLATDWVDYARHMREVLDAASAFDRANDDAGGRPDYRPRTHFEQRGERKGHEVHDLLYRRV